MLVFPKEEFVARNQKCIELMKEKGLDAILAFTDYFKHASIRYLTGYTYQPVWLASSTYILPREGEPTLLVDRFMDAVKEQVWVSDVRTISGWLERPGPAGTLLAVAEATAEILREKGLERAKIGLIGYDIMPAMCFDKMKGKLPDAQFIDVSEEFERLRMVKSDNEIALIKKANSIISKGYEAAIEAIRPGRTEADVGSAMMKALLDAGADFILALWVVSGKAAERVYRTPLITNRELKKGDMVWMDCGMAYKGYFADVGRTTIVGKATEKQKRLCDAVLKMHKNAAGIMKPGVKAGDIYEEMRRTAVETGYGDYFKPGGFVGHNIGVTLDDYPLIKPDEPTPLEKNMVMNIDPKLFVPGVGGARIEDSYLITEDGAKRLTKVPQKLW